MRLFSILFIFGAITFNFSSCIKHEVVPAPISSVDLNASLTGYVNGTQVEFNQNVEGYKGYADKDSYIYASPVLSKLIYSSTIRSNYSLQELTLSFGSLSWDASANTEPTLTMFNDFHSANSGIFIPFKDYSTLVNSSPAAIGVEVEYTDKEGIVWKSKESDPGQTAKFTILKQASDNTGDYSMFECTFSCLVWTYDVQLATDISIPITNAKFIGWFRR